MTNKGGGRGRSFAEAVRGDSEAGAAPPTGGGEGGRLSPGRGSCAGAG